MNNIFRGLVKGAVDTLNQRITASSAAEAEYIAEARKRAETVSAEKELYSYKSKVDTQAAIEAARLKSEQEKATMLRMLGVEKDKYMAANTATDNPLAEVPLAEEIPDTFTPAEAPATKTGGESFSSFGAIQKKIEPTVQPLTAPKISNVDGLSPEQLAELRNDAEAGVPIEQFNAKRKMFINQNFRRTLEEDKISGRVQVQELKGKQAREASKLGEGIQQKANEVAQKYGMGEVDLNKEYIDKDHFAKTQDTKLKSLYSNKALEAESALDMVARSAKNAAEAIRRDPSTVGLSYQRFVPDMILQGMNEDAAIVRDEKGKLTLSYKNVGGGLAGQISNYEGQQLAKIVINENNSPEVQVFTLDSLAAVAERLKMKRTFLAEAIEAGIPDSKIKALVNEYDKAVPLLVYNPKTNARVPTLSLDKWVAGGKKDYSKFDASVKGPQSLSAPSAQKAAEASTNTIDVDGEQVIIRGVR